MRINILREEMGADQAVRIKYDSKYASCSNYWKMANEQNKALQALNTMQVKRDVEKEYSDWARFQRSPKYSNALGLIKDGYAARRNVREAQLYINEGLIGGSEVLSLAIRINKMMESNPEMDLSTQDKMFNSFFKDYDEKVEKRVAAAMFEYVYAHMDPDLCPDFLKKANKKYKGDWTKYVDDLYKASIFANQENLGKYMLKPNAKQLEKDPMLLAAKEVQDIAKQLREAVSQQSKDNLKRGIRDFTDGILQVNEGRRLVAPDANSTIRLTYGNVMSYDPKDGVSYKYYTTMKGVLEKEDPENSEFIVPARLKELYAKKDFGAYANRRGEMPTCFITNNDITGGNSGSPVINANGVLIGLAFDGNSDAMSGDIDFEENLQRCICLDSRYMLWVIDVYAGAKNLIEEIDIVR